MRANKGLVDKAIIILICIVINILGNRAAVLLHLPVWLDVTGTCVAAYFTGPVGGVIAGISNNLFAGIWKLSSVAYMATSVAVGLIFSFCTRKGYLGSFSKAMISSFLIGIFSVVISTPLNLVFQDGRSGNMWGDAFFDMLDWYGMPKLLCAVAGETIVEIIDKQLCVAIAFLLIRRIKKRRAGKTDKRKAVRAAASLILMTVMVCQAAVWYVPVMAAEKDEEDVFNGSYVGTIYDSRTGMVSSEANVIEETEDGYIWIGSYAGLTRYDGSEFEFIREGGISSVTAMKTDSRGRLWVGTNDAGIARYENGKFTFFTVEDGLPVNSIRSFAEEEDGTIYVGTTDRICRIEEDDSIHVIDEEAVYINSMVVYGDLTACAANSGSLFLMRADEVVAVLNPKRDNEYYTCVGVTEYGLMAGTSGNCVDMIAVSDEQITVERQINTGRLAYISGIKADSEGRIWLCADNGFGYMDQDGELHAQYYSGFDSSIECMHQDYEGNIWLASSRYGVMKFAKNQFTDIFSVAGIEGSVVNAVVSYQDRYYCGTDSGLVILTQDGYRQEKNALTEMVEGDRVRSLMVDSQERLWVCTYGKNGLIRCDKNGRLTVFNKEEKNTTGDRFRCAVELADGTIAAGASDGINFIRDNLVVGKITAQDGLRNPQILCLLVAKDGTLYAGTDGAGIYAIRDGKLEENLTTEDGLSSDVVLRMAAYKGGYFIVASNALCYMDADGISSLDEFPYFNNYDILVDDEDAYVLSSSGIYAVKTEELLSGEDLQYKLYNGDDGLLAGLTANSWNYIDDEGRLFFCCNSGVVFFKTQNEYAFNDYKFGVASVTGDGEEFSEQDGTYVIPANVKQIRIKPSLRNYALRNVKLRFYIEGLNDNPQIVSQYDLEPIQITNLKHGSYKIHFEIMSDDGERVVREHIYTLEKEAHIWENSWYIAYLAFTLAWFIAFVTWVVIMLINISKRKKELEVLRKELEETVHIQTKEIREQARQMEKYQWSVIESLASLIESRDGNTGAHVINTRNYVAVIAEELLKRGMYPDIISREYVDLLIKAAPLHDVGKIKISDVVLNKPGKFVSDEYEIMKLHTTYGGEIIGDILGEGTEPEMLELAHDLAKYHHEKWDGTGYPTGKKGEEIPLCARIMAIADVFDALISKRVYKEPIAIGEAFRIIEEDAGKHFDAELTRIFLDRREEVTVLAEKTLISE